MAIAIALILVTVLGSAAIGGFALMILLGTLFAEFGILAPLGFLPSVGLYLLLALNIFMLSPKVQVTSK